MFSEATKQFLIESLPLVLTLNLKRFVQHGRRLQKNSRHISFPTLLDMAPFSTDSCKVSVHVPLRYCEYSDENFDFVSVQVGHCDSKGQLLYSLYGVVEHSGGMQGGHYTAYVRTRTPIKCDISKLVSKQPTDQTLREQSSVDGGASVASGEGSDLGSEFDLLSTHGQWYFISDSRVRTATENEVLKSQAYLLFYEQLPLSSN